MGFEYAGGIILPLITLANDFGNIVDLPPDIVDRYLKKIHSGYTKAVDKDLWLHNFNNMLSGLDKGYGKPFLNVEYNSPDFVFIQNLKYNTAVFDAFKINRETGEHKLKVLDDNGNIIPWKEFKQSAMPIVKQYNQRWLQTEYNYAHQSALMARKWRDFENDADLYPNLRYAAVMDERTRQSHAGLNGKVYPMSHPFWDTYYPPLDWNCRCSVLQSDAEPDTELPADMPTVPDLMRNNAGKTAKVFNSAHPYFKTANEAETVEIMRFVEQNIRPGDEVLKGWKLFNSYGAEWEKSFFDGNTGGLNVYNKLHEFHKIGGEYEKEAGRLLAKQGKQVEFNPEKFGGYKIKKIDITFDNDKWEIKGTAVGTSNSVMEAIWDGKKAKKVIIYFKNGTDYKNLSDGYDRAFGRFKKENKIMPEVYYFNTDGTFKLFTKK